MYLKRSVTALNIERIQVLDLCIYCGLCRAACPKGNISRTVSSRHGLSFRVDDPESCGRCYICYAVCPAEQIDMPGLNEEIFGESQLDPLLGYHRGTYLAHAADDVIREAGASGGVGTALLVFALEKGIIDAASVVQDGKKHITEPSIMLANKRADLLAAAKSKYYPVPIMENLAAINKRQGRFGVVGLPCHIWGLRKYERLKKSLKEKVAFQLGLFCGFGCTFAGLEFIASRAGLSDLSDVKTMRFRVGTWPGNIDLEAKNGRTFSFSGYTRDMVSILTMPPRCSMCWDQTAELADISVGDAWLPEVMHRNDGLWKSVVIVRSERGMKLFRDAVDQGAVIAQKIQAKKVIQSQKNLLEYKKMGLAARRKVGLLFGYNTPDHGFQPETFFKSSGADYIAAALFYLLNRSMLSQKCRRLLYLAPTKAASILGKILRNALQNRALLERLRRRVLKRYFCI